MNAKHVKSIFFLIALFFAHSSFSQCYMVEILKNSKVSKKYKYTETNQLVGIEEYKAGSLLQSFQVEVNDKGAMTKVEASEKKKSEQYTYDKNGNMANVTFHKGGRLIEKYTFKYKGGKVNEVHFRKKTKSGKMKKYVTLFTWTDGNVTERKTFKKDDEQLDLKKKVVYEYDTKRNPFLGYGHSVKNLSQNNIIKKTEINRFEQVDKKDSYTATYEYNEHGFPTQVLRTFLSEKKQKIELKYKCM